MRASESAGLAARFDAPIRLVLSRLGTPPTKNFAPGAGAQGEFVAQRRHHKRALAIQKSTLPCGHPDAAATLNNLAHFSPNCWRRDRS